MPPTPFPWSFDLSEDEAAAKLTCCPEQAVLVVHSPPKGYVDEVHGRHLGSSSVLEAIERKHPVLVVCGHIHQCWGGEAAIGTTIGAASAQSMGAGFRPPPRRRRLQTMAKSP